MRDGAGAALHHEVLAYDEANNPVRRLRNGVLTSYTYNAFNQLVQTERLPSQTGASFDSLASGDSALDPAHGAALVLDGLAPSGSGAGDTFLSADTDADHWLQVVFDPAEVYLVEVQLELPPDRGLPRNLYLQHSVDGGASWQPLSLQQVFGAQTTWPADGHILPGTSFGIRAVCDPVITGAVRVVQYEGDHAATHPAAYAGPAYSLGLNEVRLVGVIASSPPVPQLEAFTYDLNGNLAETSSVSYAYDLHGRLLAIDGQLGGQQVSMGLVYGPSGALLREIDNTLGHQLDHLPLGREIYADYVNGSLTRKFVHSDRLDHKIAMRDYGPGGTGAPLYFLALAQGTVHMVHDASGQALETRLTTAWGEPLDAVPGITPSADQAVPFGYTGRRRLGQTGLMDYRNRIYDPALGRFLTPDPIGTGDGLNRYSYVHSDPVNHVDPTGECGWWTEHDGRGSYWGIFLPYLPGIAIRARELDRTATARLGVRRLHAEMYDPAGNLNRYLHGDPEEEQLLRAVNRIAVRGAVTAAIVPMATFAALTATVAPGFATAAMAKLDAAAMIAAGFALQRCNSVGCRGCQSCLRRVERAASSVWNRPPIWRGRIIEQRLGGNLPGNYPTIDRFKDGVATSIKSIDLTTPSARDATKLTNTLARYVAKLAQFDGRTWAGVTVRNQDIGGRVLNVAIEPGVATAEQIAAMTKVTEWAARIGIQIKFTPIK